MDDAKALAAALGSPFGGFLVGVAAWEGFKTQELKKIGELTLHFERLGPWHDATAAIAGVGGAATLVSWAILFVVWMRGNSRLG